MNDGKKIVDGLTKAGEAVGALSGELVIEGKITVQDAMEISSILRTLDFEDSMFVYELCSAFTYHNPNPSSKEAAKMLLFEILQSDDPATLVKITKDKMMNAAVKKEKKKKGFFSWFS